MVSGAVAAGAWISANAAAIGAVGVVAGAATGYASMQQGKREANKKKQEIARQRGVAEDKRSSLIRKQRNQLGGKGKKGYSVNETGSTGLTTQGEETLG